VVVYCHVNKTSLAHQAGLEEIVVIVPISNCTMHLLDIEPHREYPLDP